MKSMAVVKQNQQYANRIARGSALVFASTFVSLFLAYLLRMFLTRTLTVAEYGLVYAVVIFVNFFVLFRDLGLNQALVKFIPEWLVKHQTGKIVPAIKWTIGIQVGIAGVAAVVLFLSAPWLAEAYFHTADAAILMQIMAGAFFVAVFSSVFIAAMQGLQNIRAYSILQPLNNLLPLIFTTIFVVLGFGIAGVISSYFVAWCVLALVAGVWVIKKCPQVRAKLENRDKKQIFAFSLPVLLGFIGGMVLGYTDTIVLTFFRSLTDVGLYQAALPTAMVLWAAATAICTVLFPMVSEMWAKRDKRVLAVSVSAVLRFAFILVLPFALIMFVWPEFVLGLLFGGAYVAGAGALQVLALSSIVYTLWQICAIVLSGIGCPGLTTKIMLGAAAFNVIGNIMLVQTFGIIGVAVATLVSFTLAFGAAFVILRKRVGLDVGCSAITKTVVSGLLMTGLIYGIKTVLITNVLIVVAVSLLAGLALYTVLILRTRAISKDDLQMLARLSIPIPRVVFKLAKAIAG
jgi:O-antigen/teichoic acid export membrane protein